MHGKSSEKERKKTFKRTLESVLIYPALVCFVGNSILFVENVAAS